MLSFGKAANTIGLTLVGPVISKTSPEMDKKAVIGRHCPGPPIIIDNPVRYVQPLDVGLGIEAENLVPFFPWWIIED